MRLFFLMACVFLFPALSSATERASLRLVELPRTPNNVSLAHAFDAPSPLANDWQLRYDDMTVTANNTVISALENAQHLGNHYRTWLWVTPMFGAVNGASIRFDLR